MRRAQIEIMGLVIVVILVTIGLFFFLALRSEPQERLVVEEYSDETLAKNFLVTLLETQHVSPETCGPGVQEIRLSDLAQDCIRSRTGMPLYYCDGMDSCAVFAGITTAITTNTLDNYGLNYNLTFTYEVDDEEIILFTLGEGCNRGLEQSSPGMQPVPLYLIAPGKAYLSLRICN